MGGFERTGQRCLGGERNLRTRMCEDSGCNSEVTPCLIPRSRSSTAFAIASAVLFGFLDFFGKKNICIYINIDLISSNSTFFFNYLHGLNVL